MGTLRQSNASTLETKLSLISNLKVQSASKSSETKMQL